MGYFVDPDDEVLSRIAFGEKPVDESVAFSGSVQDGKRLMPIEIENGADLWPVSYVVIYLCSKAGVIFDRIEAHDKGDPEGSDILWIDYTPDDDTSDGEGLFVAAGNWQVFVSVVDVYRYMGGPTTFMETFGRGDIAGLRALANSQVVRRRSEH